MKKMVVPCEVYSRVVGYYRPVNNWNSGKKQEFNERVEFGVGESLKNPIAEMENFNTIKVFTFPHCDKCEAVKSYLKQKNCSESVVDLKSTEGNKEFRRYYTEPSVREKIQRLEDGTLKLPIVLFMKDQEVISTAQSLEETKKIIA